MAAEPELKIPVLTDPVTLSDEDQRADRVKDDEPISGDGLVEALLAGHPNVPEGLDDREELIAELQTEIAASTFALTDEIMRTAFAEMEATIFEQIAGRLRRELPEMIDTLLRERLDDESDY